LQSPLTWGAAALIFAFLWVLNSPSSASGYSSIRGIGTDIEAAISARDWEYSPRSRSLGYPAEPVWLRWTVPADNSNLIAIHNPWVDNFQIFFVKDHQVLASATAGGNHAASSREIDNPEYVFELPDSPRPDSVYILDSESTSPALYPVSFTTWQELVSYTTTLHVLHGIFYGIMLIMLIYNAVIYTSVGDRAYLYLVLYTFSLTVLIATSDGFGQHYLWRDSTWLQNALVSISLTAVIVFLGQFCISFLELRKHLPLAARVVRALQLLIIANTATILLVDNEFSAPLEPVILLVFAAMLVVIGTWRAWQGSGSAQIFLVANGIVCLFGSLVALTHLGWIPDSAVGRQGALLGAALEVALLSIALARRLKRQERLQELLRAKTDALTEEVQQLKAASDLAEQHRQLQRSMQHQQKLKTIGQMAGGIAHDFNNILATILGFTELALERPDDKDKQLRYLQEVRDAGQRGAALVKQLITYSRGDQRTVSTINLNHAVGEAVTLLRGSLPATVSLRPAFPEKRLSTELDATQLKQVLVNLCLNASEAMSNRGSINLALSEQQVDSWQCSSCLHRFSGSYAAITVEDAGAGIEGRPYELFTPFFTTKPVGRGSGLGLSVVHGIVHEQGGHIIAGNREQGGSRFVIYLPLHEPAPIQEPRKEHILLIEDDLAMSRYLETLLKEQGYKVSVVALPTTALEKFMETPDSFDLVITDQVMPHGTGMELAQDLLELRPDLPIILTTGSADLISHKAAKQSGIRAVFSKPISSDLLLSRIRGLLQGAT
jgi:signal transduction histidine kinase/CheY-like chemotaxis protein